MKSDGFYKIVKNVLLKLQGMSRTQAIAAAVSAAVAVGGIGTGGYFIYANNNQLKETVAEADVKTEQGTETESEELIDLIEETEMIVGELLEVTEETETVEVEQKKLTLVGSSIEKDLKIKVQDQSSKVVSGEMFAVTVKSDRQGEKESTFEDKDKDGIIYIDKLDAGKYTVSLSQVEGYEIEKGSITVTVKDKIAYEKVDVTGEIKKESEVNSKVEDTASNNVPVEGTVRDTVALIESTVSATTVPKSEVDTSNFTKSAASADNNSAVCTKKISAGSTETPTVPPTETPTVPPTEKPTEKPIVPPTEKPTVPPTEKPTVPPTEKPTETPTETQEPSESLNPTEISAVNVVRNDISRVGTSLTAETTATATVSLPKKITLYNSSNVESNSYVLNLSISGDTSVIQSVTWGCTDTSVVSLSATSGNSVTVTKGRKGSANIGAVITYYTDDKGNTASVTVQTTVNVTGFTDESTVLKDKNGNTLYIDAKAQKAATLKDYDSIDQFYTMPKYTGWQTIDGKVYYYNDNNQAVTGNQVIGGVTYTFAEDGSLGQSSGSRGIDVSKWQGNIDWGAVASSGISFAIIRAGYRGASTGVLVEDPYFRKNIAGATRAGIKVGVYFFTQAITEAEAVEEASMALSLVSGYKMSYPIFIDTESASGGRANGLDSGTRTAVVKAFCQTVQNGGYKAGVYASKSWFNNQLHASALNGYCIWVAQYNSSCTYSGKHDMWQYSSKGSVAGIKGNVDMNISYMGY